MTIQPKHKTLLADIQQDCFTDFSEHSRLDDNRLEALTLGKDQPKDEERLWLVTSLATHQRARLIEDKLRARTLRRLKRSPELTQPFLMAAASTGRSAVYKEEPGFTVHLESGRPGTEKWVLKITFSDRLLENAQSPLVVTDGNKTHEYLRWVPGDDATQYAYFDGHEFYDRIKESGLVVSPARD